MTQVSEKVKEKNNRKNCCCGSANPLSKHLLHNYYVQGRKCQDLERSSFPHRLVHLLPQSSTFWSSQDLPFAVLLWICESCFGSTSYKSASSLSWSQCPNSEEGTLSSAEAKVILTLLRMRSQADFYHSYVSSNKPRIFLTLESTKFRASQEVWNFFCRQSMSFKDFKQGLDTKKVSF